VRDASVRTEAVASVAAVAAAAGWPARGVATSPLPGPSGNVEFFLWLRRGPATVDAERITDTVHAAAGVGVPGEKVDP
jgi:23S rRNA (cytidine1920-2'-O)/16S rRNA (cytidine1409-2'-O)-methyltransferase